LYSKRNSDATNNARFIFTDRNGGSEGPKDDNVWHLEDASSEFFRNGRAYESVISGRVSWNECLLLSFPTFGQLQDARFGEASLLGSALGCAAKIFAAIANAEDDGIPFELRKRWIYDGESSQGLGYVNSSKERFPELYGVFNDALNTSKNSLMDAIRTYESLFSN
jgi:hypothetical protein